MERTSATQPVGRRRTIDSLMLDDDRLLRECEVDTFRAHGPGGQKRNKTDSAIRLRHRPTGLVAIAVETRSQHQNKAKALRRLRHTIAVQSRWLTSVEGYLPCELLCQYRTAPKPVRRRRSAPSAKSRVDVDRTAESAAGSSEVENGSSQLKQDILDTSAITDAPPGAGISINPRNDDYPLVLREVMDVIFACGLRMGEAAAKLGLSTSQLVKFLRNDGHAWAHVNQHRVSQGEKPLR